ncbi:hypothetical protein EVAR_19232_1 [Eumeta japonica]|uniref:Uncharacterized protein n=1 Tax=Eumeta variegata TaxID=151549 RepID=A0A4C1VER7_EUMVA|nr:hypothetical protein EVAR_19232_1 [Eumeta japonica]
MRGFGHSQHACVDAMTAMMGTYFLFGWTLLAVALRVKYPYKSERLFRANVCLAHAGSCQKSTWHRSFANITKRVMNLTLAASGRVVARRVPAAGPVYKYRSRSDVGRRPISRPPPYCAYLYVCVGLIAI